MFDYYIRVSKVMIAISESRKPLENQLFDYKITFVNSQHENTNFLIYNSMFALSMINSQKKFIQHSQGSGGTLPDSRYFQE